MKELSSSDIAKLSKEELALFGLVETFDNVNIEIKYNNVAEVTKEDISGIEL